MNFKTIAIAAISFLVTTSSFALSNKSEILKKDILTPVKEVNINPSDIFFADYDNNYLFVDFEAVGTSIYAISIYKDQKLVSTEDVSDLPASTIYEVNFDELERNINYKIELETQDGKSIYKEFVIN